MPLLYQVRENLPLEVGSKPGGWSMEIKTSSHLFYRASDAEMSKWNKTRVQTSHTHLETLEKFWLLSQDCCRRTHFILFFLFQKV